MKRWQALSLIGLFALTIIPQTAHGEGQEIEKQIPRLEVAMKRGGFETRLKRRYNLSNADLAQLHARGMNDAQITIAAQLSEATGRPITEIQRLRKEENLGWSEIAKKFGIRPLAIGQLVALMHR